MKRLVLCAACLLAVYGCHKLSDGDKQVCAKAAASDAQGVFSVASLADNKDIKRQAGRIQLGTSDADDRDAMTNVVRICQDNGWKQPR